MFYSTIIYTVVLGKKKIPPYSLVLIFGDNEFDFLVESSTQMTDDADKL